jgi:hypothetical protein
MSFKVGIENLLSLRQLELFGLSQSWSSSAITELEELVQRSET